MQNKLAACWQIVTLADGMEPRKKQWHCHVNRLHGRSGQFFGDWLNFSCITRFILLEEAINYLFTNAVISFAGVALSRQHFHLDTNGFLMIILPNQFGTNPTDVARLKSQTDTFCVKYKLLDCCGDRNGHTGWLFQTKQILLLMTVSWRRGHTVVL